MIRRWVLWLGAAMIAVAVTLGVVAARVEPVQTGGVIALDMSGPRPTAWLSILDAAPVKVIFDTGAGGSVLTSALGRRHNLPDQGEVQIASPGSESTIPAYITTLPRARLGEVDISGQRAVVGDLGVPLEGISGVMNPNFFRGSLVRFELKASRVVVVPKLMATMPTGVTTPYHGDHPLPSIEVDIAGVKMYAHLDTGSGRGLSLPLEMVQRFKLKGPLVPGKPVKMAGGERDAFDGRIDGVVVIGPLRLIDPEVTFIARFTYANVGFSLLKGLTVVLDPAERRSWVMEAE